jgi:hypothetical protein
VPFFPAHAGSLRGSRYAQAIKPILAAGAVAEKNFAPFAGTSLIEGSSDAASAGNRRPRQSASHCNNQFVFLCGPHP